MPLADQRHTVRFPLPDLIVRGRDHVLSAPIYLDGALVTTTAATVTVYDASGSVVVTAAATPGTTTTYTVLAATTTSLTLSERWRVEWALTHAGGVIYARNDAALVRSGLYPVISDVDVYRRIAALDPSGTAPITSRTDYQDELDEAWTELMLRLINRGNRPNLIMEPSALRQAHLYLTLAIIFEGQLSSRLDSAYDEKAMRFRAEYERAYNELSPRYDVADAGQADTKRRGGPTVWLNGGRGTSWGTL